MKYLFHLKSTIRIVENTYVVVVTVFPHNYHM